MAITTVYVQSRQGNPVKGARVSLGFAGITRGMSRDAYTDADGRAFIEHADGGQADVYVDGKRVGNMRTPGVYAYTRP